MGCELGVLGVGHLASALLDGVFKRGVLAPEQVLLADAHPVQLDRFAAMDSFSRRRGILREQGNRLGKWFWR